MAEKTQFLPRAEVLTIEELEEISLAFIRRGVRKIRITGGEPLVRKNVMSLFQRLGQELGKGLDELTLTTNATRLAEFAAPLVQAGVQRVNVSLDSLNPETSERISRRGDLETVLRGIEAAQVVGLKVKLNTVVLKDENVAEIPDLVEWAHSRNIDVTLIEVMPLGDTGQDRFDQYVPLHLIREQLQSHMNLVDTPSPNKISGPARYVTVPETGGRIGFITPLTNNFCAGCNRVRVTCTGRIYMCLGQDDHIDLRRILRSNRGEQDLDLALDKALGAKPEKHDFAIDRPSQTPSLSRHMSLTGG